MTGTKRSPVTADKIRGLRYDFVIVDDPVRQAEERPYVEAVVTPFGTSTYDWIGVLRDAGLLVRSGLPAGYVPAKTYAWVNDLVAWTCSTRAFQRDLTRLRRGQLVRLLRKVKADPSLKAALESAWRLSPDIEKFGEVVQGWVKPLRRPPRSK